MKLTPEQKAFLEYGKAIATLKYRIERIRFTARVFHKMEYRELPRRFRGGLWDDFQLYYAIGDVRRKRAECKRRIIPERKRRCMDCKFWNYSVNEYPCCSCRLPHQDGDYWEPR